MMPKVELIYDNDCPNVEAARQQIRRAFQELREFAKWDEWNQSDPSIPDHARRYGSPTILVDGKDVMDVLPLDGANCCRVYHSKNGGFQGVPPVEAITTALRNSATSNNNANSALRSWFAVLPAVGVAMLPNLTCPACWPAYAGLLSSFGLGFLTQTSYLLPLTVVFLVMAVGALGFRPAQRHSYGPFLFGLVAAIVVVAGKFLFDSGPVMYGGIALLIGASIWNTWRKRKKSPSCSACGELGDY